MNEKIPAVFRPSDTKDVVSSQSSSSGGCVGILVVFMLAIVGTYGSLRLCMAYNDGLLGVLGGLLLPYLTFQNGAAAVSAKLFKGVGTGLMWLMVKRVLLLPFNMLWQRFKPPSEEEIADRLGDDLAKVWARTSESRGLTLWFVLSAGLTSGLGALVMSWGATATASYVLWIPAIVVYQVVLTTSGFLLCVVVAKGSL